MVGTKSCSLAKVREPQKSDLSSDCRLQLACMKLESLVIAGQPYCGEFVAESCTHRPSHLENGSGPKTLQTVKAGSVIAMKS